jgi:biopolymer transport protein ExbD
MRKRRLRKTPAALEVSAFINLIVVLVPFLLSTTVFTRLAIMELSLPAQSSSFEKLTGDLQLEVVVRVDALEIGDKIGGLIQRIPATANGHDTKALGAVIKELKQRFPQVSNAAILAEPNTPYDVLVQVMDKVRAGHQVQGAKLVAVDLFPDISIGDAPVRQKQARL